ncbi:hypothetical protein AB0M79_15050 [Polymorphospora sp. NPDC051019]|uniref:hypothetical protein n=1 Tax=Polymorphospora sp. NPDC051019 TaxID=3155725 RepID=UPI0034428EC2
MSHTPRRSAARKISTTDVFKGFPKTPFTDYIAAGRTWNRSEHRPTGQNRPDTRPTRK